MRNVIVCLFLISTIASFAQKPLYSHQQWFKVEDGLPQGFVSEIMQDDAGFLWISTLDGLARYDGRGFRIFQQDTKDSSSISSNVIAEMVYGRDKKLWLFYQGQQLDAFNPATLRVSGKNFPPLIEYPKTQQQRFAENGGKYWTFLNSDGISWMDISSFATGTASVKNGLLKDKDIIATAYHPDGRVWLLSKNSIQVSDSSRTHFRYVPLQQPLPADIDIVNAAQWEIYGDEMVVMSREYLWFINYKDGSYRKYDIPAVKDFDGRMRKLRMGLDGKLYARSFYGVYRVNRDGTMSLLWNNTILPGRKITAFMVDRSEVLWVGLDAGGLVKVNLRSMPMNSYSYKDNFPTDILTSFGIPAEQIPATWKKTPWSYGFRYAYGIDSTFYFSLHEGFRKDFYVYGFRDGKTFRLPFPKEYELAVIRGLSVDKTGKIWAIDEYNKVIWCWQNDKSMPNRYTLDMVYPQIELAYMVVKDDMQWVTTHGQGMYKIRNGQTLDHIDKNSKPNDIPYDLTEICADPTNPDRLWIGSRGAGLILWDIHKKLQRSFTQADGLPNNTVYCIVPDSYGKLWLSTNKGICRFDPLTYEVHNFEKNDGLPGNEFNRAHEFRFPDGRIALGGIEGYVIFQPRDFSLISDTVPMPIELTEILINNRQLNYGEKNSLLKTPLMRLEELTLPYNKNYINISFAALQFNEPQKIRYRYRLRGLSNDWIESGHNNTAHYTQLDPGEYTLEINATNLEGNWSSYTRKLKLQILPPIWKTWWAYAVYLIAAITATLFYFKYRERRLKAQQQLIFEQKESERLRDIDEVKTRFFSNITHEFRTPLTLITAPLEKLANDPAMPAPLLDTVHTIQRNAIKLLALINQLLDLSKIEAGHMKLHLSIGELSVFVEECVHSFAAAAMKKNIQLKFSAGTVQGLYRFDEEKWERIITNLISNALKFTPEDGEVSVTLLQNGENNIQLRVQDSGPGIPADQLQKIFDRFYQADTSSTRHYEGTGIGLSLVKELTRLMGGTVQAENTAGQGALFIVSAPLEKTGEYAVVKNIISPAASVKNVSTETITGSREKPVILVAEDNDELRSFVADTLSSQWNILQVSDGEAAWEMILAEMPDIVVSDVMMPFKDGIELSRLTKNDPRTAHIGFILLTAKVSHGNKIEGLGTGADDYITKPFHLDELQLRIQNLLQLQERMRAHLQSILLPASPAEAPAVVINPFLQELYLVLDEQLDNPQLGVELLASRMNMSKSTLNRKLKTLLDISTNDLIRRYRLQKAAQMIREGVEIAGAAYRSGFSSPSYFSQCFKEEYGMTPTSFSEQRISKS